MNVKNIAVRLAAVSSFLLGAHLALGAIYEINMWDHDAQLYYTSEITTEEYANGQVIDTDYAQGDVEGTVVSPMSDFSKDDDWSADTAYQTSGGQYGVVVSTYYYTLQFYEL